MRALFLAIALLLAAGTVSCTGEETAQSDRLWTCSMDPQVLQDHPGTCPICGMDLVPVEETTGVTVHPGMEQKIGVQTEPVERGTIFRHIRALGTVEVGENELSVVNLRFSGWVEKLYVDKTGDEVRRGQILFDIYSPELVAAQEEYLVGLRTSGPDAPLTKSARRKLELWDVGERDIDAIATAGESRRTVPIRAPQAGFVLHKNVVEGARVQAGHDLYRIGNLQRIWVQAEVYEHDAPWVEVGQPAQLELTHLAGQVLEGKVSYIYPTLDARSRTLTVRLEFENPGVRLKPGMFATVYIEFRRVDDVLAVPTEAILHSGRRQLVFVALGGGSFEPREVTTGLVGDHRRTEVVDGLQEGDLVVVSGQFLLDSESQLQAALRKLRAGSTGTEEPGEQLVWSCPMHPEVVSDAPGQCPTCGMDLEQRPATEDELDDGHDHGAKPGQYTCPMHPEVVSDEPGRCPKCGMFLEKVEEDAAP